jgi:hypothetical protein
LIKKVINEANNYRLKLVFDENQLLNVENEIDYGHYKRNMAQFVFNGPSNFFSDSIWAEQNVVYINYNFLNEGNLTYLPPMFLDDRSNHYDGPSIKNSNDLQAASFFEFPIAQSLEEPKIDTFLLYNNGVSIIFKNKADCSNCTFQVYNFSNENTPIDYLGQFSYDIDTLFIGLNWAKDLINIKLLINIESESSESGFSEIKFSTCPNLFIKERIPYMISYIKGNTLKYSSGRSNQELILKFDKFISFEPGFEINGFSPFLAEIGKCANN